LFKPGTWRSPLRGQWLTSLLGLVLLCGLPIVAVTGLLSYVAYMAGLEVGQSIGGWARWTALFGPRGLSGQPATTYHLKRDVLPYLDQL